VKWFEDKLAIAGWLFEFGRTGSGTFIAKTDELNITVEADSLSELKDAAREAIQLLDEDLHEDGMGLADYAEQIKGTPRKGTS
jgi:predicted RNase H-like HicB family nuclease